MAFIKYEHKLKFEEPEMKSRSVQFLSDMSARRTIRSFSDKPVPVEVIENSVKAAATAPSGANQQPWHFVIISDPEIKTQIRRGAEDEEKAFYNGKAPGEWLEALKPLGTDEHKPFLETAPYLIVVFEEKYGIDEKNQIIKHYYTKESVGIACGILISSLHLSGLATLSHTPSPMNFLNKILKRPLNERPYLILVTGYPAEDVEVPVISKKPFESVVTIINKTYSN